MPLLSPSASELTANLPTKGRHTERTGALLHALEWLVLLVIVGYVGFRTLPRAWNHLNTDFPNYYVAARLVREGYSTRHIYEWMWLQRQKDRMGILPAEQPVVGFVPHTPFSALLLWPLTSRPPLAAKHIWIVFNLLLLVQIGVLLRSLTHLDWRRLALLIGLCYPMLRNVEYGQYYIVILAILTSALYLYVRGQSFTSGLLVGFAAGLKVFPVFFLLYFARKRDLRASIGLVAGTLATVGLSLWAFGLEAHRTYLTQVLPWAMRGDAMDPYALSPSSISALLHKLFIFEPQWNPHPALHAPALYAILHSLLQLLVLAPCIYLASPRAHGAARLQLEWSAFLVALLTISTLPASYHFTLLILPTAVLASLFMCERKYLALALLLVLYLAIGFPAWHHPLADGWPALIAVPRLYVLLIMCGVCYFTLSREDPFRANLAVDRSIWAAAFVALFVIQVLSALRHQRGLYDSYQNRVSLPADILSASVPRVTRSDGISFIALTTDGYKLGSVRNGVVSFAASTKDQLAHTGGENDTWWEEAGTQSHIVRLGTNGPAILEIADAESPVVSADGQRLAYLRSDRGRNSLWIRSLSDPSRPDAQLTSNAFDVEEMTFVPDGSLIFAGEQPGQGSELFQITPSGKISSLHSAPARYPAASPDGHWLAYSRLEGGVWKLWLQDLRTGQIRRITSAECNDISPAWQPDSKTIAYASDCGRALWFTALVREQVLP
jgi:glycosyl transferase family 87/WD40 repeat protein